MKDTEQTIITLHRLAPTKPEFGASCNGCGVCCAAEPCPVAQLFLWQFRGSCRALLWRDSDNRYVCGMVQHPKQFVSFLPTKWISYFGRWCAKRISTGHGCDSDCLTE